MDMFLLVWLFGYLITMGYFLDDIQGINFWWVPFILIIIWPISIGWILRDYIDNQKYDK